MKTSKLILVIPLFLLSCATVRHSEITQKELESEVKYLSSDKLGGRLTGSQGDILSEKYIAKQLKRAGLTPWGKNGLEEFEAPIAADTGPSNKVSINGKVFEPGKDFTPLAMTSNGKLDADVIFAGYGFSVVNDSMQWDDYSGIDVKDKWVLLLRGYPEGNTKAASFKSLSPDRVKVLTAKDKGAAGVLLVSGETWDSADNLDIPVKGTSTSGIPVLQLKRQVADLILEKIGSKIKDLETRLNRDLSPDSFDAETTVSAQAEVNSRSVRTSNVVMKLEGSSLRDQYIIIGAHFDHLGMGGIGSGSRMPDTVAVHHGADDNASGVALMIELAQKLANDKRHARSLIFVAFTGEEQGLLGSRYFVDSMKIRPSDIDLMINLDMVGRMKEGNGLQVGGVGTASGLRDTVSVYNDTTRIALSFTDEGYGPSDHSSFYGKDIPVLFVTTGAHLDYHTPLDTYDRINYDGMVSIGNMLYKLITAAADDPAKLAFREAGPKAPTQTAGRMRGVTLGIMPDFAGNVKNGLRADFVTPGKPAALGGMKKGDIIVAVDNKPVSNIEDYMFRLSQLKPGQTITVDVMRNGVREVLIIQL